MECDTKYPIINLRRVYDEFLESQCKHQRACVAFVTIITDLPLENSSTLYVVVCRHWRLSRVNGGISRRNGMDSTGVTQVVSPCATVLPLGVSRKFINRVDMQRLQPSEKINQSQDHGKVVAKFHMQTKTNDFDYRKSFISASMIFSSDVYRYLQGRQSFCSNVNKISHIIFLSQESY